MNFQGLSGSEASELLKKYGLNQLPSKRSLSILKLFASQFKNVMSLILLVAVVLSFLVGDKLDAGLIFVILSLNILLGFWQEFKASKELEALRKMEVSTSRVIRDGKETEISSYEIVPGDIVILEAGDKIPADGIIIESYDFAVNQSSLTGESLPVIKSKEDEDNEVYFGTTVSAGRGKIKVTATGVKTKFGHIALTLAEVEEEPTPLEVSLDSLAKRLAVIAISIAVFVFILRLFQGYEILEVFFGSIALMIAAVPEGLPAVVTVLLALGVRRMYQKKTLVRRMSAIESLGATSVICTDKTGTLTKNEMQVKEVIMRGTDPKRILLAATLCNSASLVLKEDHGTYDVLGDTTEGALLFWAKKKGVDIDSLKSSGKIIEEIPFDLKRKMMSVLWEDHKGNATLYSKGAPESILPLCNLSEKQSEEFTKNYQRLAAKGLRVLAVAFKNTPKKGRDLEKGLNFLGLIGIADEAREEAKLAIQKAKMAGIQVVMVTGDNELTAKAIAEEVGLLEEGQEVLTGVQLEELTNEELEEKLSKVRVFARVIPEHKLRIVQAFQRIGKVVAVTGDGVNDSLALKQAHVGVAMGTTGTEVAKESSDIIILDDNLYTIILAIEEGRTIYNNILKTVKFLMVGNLSEVLVIVVAALMALPSPFLPVQLLWINFVTDGLPALSLSADKPSRHIMSAPPRDVSRPILNGPTLRYVLLFGGGIALINILIFIWAFYGRKDINLARSLTFSTLVVSQMVYIFIMRRHHSILSNKYLLASVAFVFIMQFLILTYPPLKALFKI